jgi:uncharacterized LabA/DUF88 family protein
MLKIAILVDGQNSKTWGIDYKKLTKYVQKHYEKFLPFIKIKRIYLTVEENMGIIQQEFWNVMMSLGFEVLKREYRKEQKADVDAYVGSELRKYAYQCDLIVLVAGDGDYLPVLEDLVGEGLANFLIITKRGETSSDINSYLQTSTDSAIQVKYLDGIDACR